MYISDKPLTVFQLNDYVQKLLNLDPMNRGLEVTGEISGFKRHYSGHCYFSLKDPDARIACVMFRSSAMKLRFLPEDGMRVILRGRVSLYVKDGSYQFYVDSMRQEGRGELYERFERLKRRLDEEGLFDPARKRLIPFHPRTIGLVTSETGAAVRDMIRVARRRDPFVGIIVSPCAVQGAAAAPEIVRAIERLNENGECDVLLIGRGGGSIEDLWAFNEESVARAIAASKIPTISCVGHEIDFTIADFVADERAATPSAAAARAVPVRDQLVSELNTLKRRLGHALVQGQRVRWAELERIAASPTLRDPSSTILRDRTERLADLGQRADSAIRQSLEHKRHALQLAGKSLSALDPSGVLARGYAYVTLNGSCADSVEALNRGDMIGVHMRDGTVDASVKAVRRENN